MKPCTVMHGPQRMSPTDFGDPQTSSSATIRSKCWFVQYFKAAELITFPSALAVLHVK